jgi:hypothetical protein
MLPFYLPGETNEILAAEPADAEAFWESVTSALRATDTGSVFALQRLGADVGARPAIGHLVLLAPDFDSQTFVDLLPRLAPRL